MELFIEMKKFLPFLGFLFPVFLFSQNGDSLQIKTQEFNISPHTSLKYEQPKIADIYRKIPKNIAGMATDAVSQKYYLYSLGSLGLTAALIPADPVLIKHSRRMGERVGFNENHTYHNFGPLKIVPGDGGSFLYFMGNGTTFILIGSGLATYGLIKNDYRAISTSMQLMQSILMSGIVAQSLKRITGRESPFITAGNGREHSSWQFFPSFSSYQKNTSAYDAMPSGHLTTGVAAWVILAENYPEKKWIKPLGFTLMGLMSFEMVQSGVHWTSDYPVAILLGYLIGKNIAKNAMSKTNTAGASRDRRYSFSLASSYVYGNRVAGITVGF